MKAHQSLAICLTTVSLSGTLGSCLGRRSPDTTIDQPQGEEILEPSGNSESPLPLLRSTPEGESPPTSRPPQGQSNPDLSSPPLPSANPRTPTREHLPETDPSDIPPMPIPEPMLIPEPMPTPEPMPGDTPEDRVEPTQPSQDDGFPGSAPNSDSPTPTVEPLPNRAAPGVLPTPTPAPAPAPAPPVPSLQPAPLPSPR